MINLFSGCFCFFGYLRSALVSRQRGQNLDKTISKVSVDTEMGFHAYLYPIFVL